MILTHIGASLRETFPARASEWALGLMLFLWSVILVTNTDLFATSRSYTALLGIMPQRGWAVLCLIGGGGRLIVLAINGAWRRSPHLRAGMAFVGGLFWFSISLGLWQAGTFGTGLAVYPVLFLLDSFNAVRGMGEAGLIDRAHRRTAKHGTDT